MPSAAIDIRTFSEARANLKAVFDRAADDHVPVVVNRRRGKAVVVMSLDDWNGWQETNYLNSTAANRAHLDESIAQAERGDLIPVERGEDGIYRRVETTPE